MHSAIVIARADARPMYQQIVEQVRERLRSGDWPPGFELPSIRQLAVELTISVITVKRAYSELEHQGAIVTQHGRGSFVAEPLARPSRPAEASLDRHLAEAARIASSLGLSRRELQARLREVDASGAGPLPGHSSRSDRRATPPLPPRRQGRLGR